MKDKLSRFEAAMQKAMAAELRARVYRENRNQTWLQKEADVSASAWRGYFGVVTRQVPMGTVLRLAEAAGMTAGELITVAERDAPRYLTGLVTGIEADEADDLQVAIDRTQPQESLPPSMKRNEGRSAANE
jgi:hypothetical protein